MRPDIASELAVQLEQEDQSSTSFSDIQIVENGYDDDIVVATFRSGNNRTRVQFNAFEEEEYEVATPTEWQRRTGIIISDPDGWRRKGDPPWTQPISREDFIERAKISTVMRWPQLLKDEV